MLSARGVLRREKGKRELVLPGRTLEEILQESQPVQIPEIDPAEDPLSKYKKLAAALPLLDQTLAKLQFYKPSFDDKRSDPQFETVVAKFNTMLKTTQAHRNSFHAQKESLESRIESAEHEQGLKSYQTFLKEQRNEMESLQALQAEARDLYRQRGPLCDSEGFYQHSTECWSDSIQQLFLNADGLKEMTQHHLILYADPSLNSLPDRLFLRVFNPLTLGSANRPTSNEVLRDLETDLQQNRDLIYQQKQWASLYFHEVKKRFLRHYLTEGKRRAFLEQCSRKEPGQVAKQQLAALSKEARSRKQGKEGVTSAILGKLGLLPSANGLSNTFRGLAVASPESYLNQTTGFVHGGDIGDIILLLNLYNTLFFSNSLDYLLVDEKKGRLVDRTPGVLRRKIRRPEDISFETTRGVFLTCDFFDTTETLINSHMFAMYSCGGHEFLYDNISGVVPFPWKQFFPLYFAKADQKPSIRFCSYRRDDTSHQVFIPVYPILVFQTVPPSYATFLDGSYVEFQEFPFTRGSIVLSDDGPVRLTAMIFVNQAVSHSIQNSGFQFQSEARIGRLKSMEAKRILDAIQTGDEGQAIRLLTETEIPLEMTVPAPKTGIPYPLVYLAVRVGWASFLQELLKRGFDPNSKLTQGPRPGITALLLAITMGREDLVQILLDAKADPNLADEKGFRAVHNAVLQMNPRILQTLVDAGANVNAQTSTGATPLFLAASNDSVEMIQSLCSKGADPTLKAPAFEGGPPVLPVAVAKTLPAKAALMKCRLLRKGGTRRIKQAKRSTRRRN
jgi:uncharacterized protein